MVRLRKCVPLGSRLHRSIRAFKCLVKRHPFAVPGCGCHRSYIFGLPTHRSLTVAVYLVSGLQILHPSQMCVRYFHCSDLGLRSQTRK